MMKLIESAVKDAVKEALANRADIEQRIKTLQSQLAEKSRLHREAEAEADRLNQERLDALSAGKGTKEIYAAYDKAVSSRNRLAEEVDLIESRGLVRLYQELSLAHQGIKNVLDRELLVKQNEILSQLQASFDEADKVYCRWLDCASGIVKTYNVGFSKHRFDLTKYICMSDAFRTALAKRCKTRIAKYVRRET